ncbi:MAG: DUF1553 domain-containing protein [Limisphaerales bacterium]|nr:MAG: DUF1553 domain-containing protein [Limisphaerales bacterium]
MFWNALGLQGKEGEHWAFIPPQHHAPPVVKQADWPKNPIDRFILAELESTNLKPSPETDKITLLRRVHLDVIGLPPTPDEVKAFLADQRPNAYEVVVERLLASPRYGERWGRHWLDAARYADSDGYSHDAPRVMWQYRDWVIRATNDDLPFDQFVVEQLAGDMLPNATAAQRVATGFHRNTQINSEGGVDREQFRIDSIFDRVATTGEVLFGLTFGCAQCHDHKYDPIKQVEYYRMFAYYNQVDEPRREIPTTAEFNEQKNHDQKVTELSAKVNSAEQGSDTRKKLEAELAKLKKTRPRATTALVMMQRSSPRVTHRFIQGNFTRPAEVMKPGVPGILHSFPESESANRLDFARWVTSRKNPLMARVTMNRMWLHYFGKGIVETENDFGTQGSAPSHPVLLDWLAAEFMRTQWSRKAMHRLMVTSATYRQSSKQRADLTEADPYNNLLGRQSRLRLDAEIVRDNALAASGLLSTKMGGPGVFPPQPPGCMNLGQHRRNWTASKGEDRYRRAVYTYRWRATPHPALKVFDAPDAFASCTRRIRSNTPLQALTLLNDPAFFEIAQGLAERVLKEGGKTDEARIALGVRLCLAREPDARELSVLKSFLSRQRELYAGMDVETLSAVVHRAHGAETVDEAQRSEQAAWVMLARVLLNLDETITRE